MQVEPIVLKTPGTMLLKPHIVDKGEEQTGTLVLFDIQAVLFVLPIS